MTTPRVRFLVMSLVLLAAPAGLSAIALLNSDGATADAQRIDEAALAQLEWRSIGPGVMGGRIDDLAIDEPASIKAR